MGLNCGATCAKYVLFVFNIVFFLGGAAVLGVGIWVRVDTGSYYDFLNKVDPTGVASEVTGNVLSDNLQYIHTVAYVLIGVGAFVFVVGFMGCCGAIKQWRPLLISYAICLIIIMCIEVGVGIAVGVYKDKVLDTVTTEMQAWAKEYDYRKVITPQAADKIIRPTGVLANSTAAAIGATNGWNAMHVLLQCCGAKSYHDFAGSPYSRNSPPSPTLVAPVFCCKLDDPAQLRLADIGCATTRTDENSNRQTGCVDRVREFVEANAPAVIGVAVGIGLIELVGIIFAFCLCCAIGDKGKRYN